MSGFASLLSQFKETTQAAAAASSSSSNGGGSNKRTRTSFEQSSSIQPHHQHQLGQKQTKISPKSNYCYPSSAPVKTIYIACPANAETGGPEALHQLCHMINSGEYYFHEKDTSKEGDEAHDEFGRLITDKSSSSSKQNQVDKGKRQLKAFMLYLRERSSGNASSVEQVFADRSPRPSKYDKYNAPIAEHQFPSHLSPSSDSTSGSLSNNGGYSSDLVIWPEVWTHLIDSLQLEPSLNATKYQSAIWWLSVNNNKGRFAPQQFVQRRDILHLVQSSYARDYVRTKLSAATSSNGVGSDAKKNNEQQQQHVLTLTEFIPYTSSEFALPLTPAAKATTDKNNGSNKEPKLNLVVYNPAKGMHWTDEIIRRACGKQARTERDGSVTTVGGIRFRPIGKGLGGRERMTGEEVVELLKTAKVYIDFGPHPGMDRLPREAALAGCVVITNREGAANFDDDVPLPSIFKFAQFNVDKICSLIKECCTKHDEYAKKLEKYRAWILDQRVQMKACVDGMINDVVKKRIVFEETGEQ
eukprot:CAMPEP_0201741210 /NCGR_PEP_ID=MMETSP0593-20130828/46697_1 /ASSEMBLY_ACC=CAM_ASM_000672 /TAXON_ID=267983 /ORGANISM="Skeletonema japonicum, Strain CCMP2506" /LENGTH=526 /DNA_ID=CAMNT_0048235539 /DNA_START=1 /DNA_END=1581 /DNA_ORIENTATION=-